MSSAISGYISQIQNAVYGEQVRSAIVSALEACYSDVESPNLQSAAFQTAIEAAYQDGILDIITVTSFNDMTNQNIIYRYNGTAAGKQKGLYYYSALSSSWVLIGSEIQKVSLLSQMTDVNDIYKYIGTETGMVQNSLYCHNGTSWVPIGSGVLTAATAALMTNTGAIYKYTGNESGYITNALYYYNGTAFVPLLEKESIDAAIENSQTELLMDMTEAASGEGNNIINPDSLKALGYYYDTTDGETEISDSNYRVTPDFIAAGANGIVYFSVARTSSGSFYYSKALCYDEDKEYLGASTWNASTTVGRLILKRGTAYIKLQYYGTRLPSDLCITDEPITEFKEYAVDISERVIKESLLDKSALAAEFMEKVPKGNNLVDPSNLNSFGYYISYLGTFAPETSSIGQNQTTKEPISAENNLVIYVRSNKSVGSIYKASIYCYSAEGTYLNKIDHILNTTAQSQYSLPSGTDHFHIQINIYEDTFPASELCISFESLDSFEPFSFDLQLKSSLLPDAKNALQSTLYKKNALAFGDSIFGPLITNRIKQITGLNSIYNAAIGGTSMAIKNQSGNVFTKWWTMANIAACISSGDWTDTINALTTEGSGSTSDAARARQALAAANYLSELDFSDIDLIIIFHGANDSPTDDENNPTDPTTYGGAIRSIIEGINTTYPKIKLVFCSVVYSPSRVAENKQRLEILESACGDYNVQFIDDLTGMGINSLNSASWLADGLHLNDDGKMLLGENIAKHIW